MEKVKILTDEPVNKDDKLGFDQYASALVNIIMGSDPQFTIGIFGGWGTGKTTLMQIMHEKLEGGDYEEYVVPVWFNAWLYEREKYLAIVPLLNTVLEKISDRPELELDDVKHTISNALSSLKSRAKFGLNIGVASVEYSPGETENDAVDQEDTLYYSRFKQIELALNELNKKNNLRIVVFIDDLDRCAPDKVLEVLESIKIFLGISGFIYVLGLSQNVIETCINNKYKDLGIKGEDYVKKIIQIPFRIPEWREDELKDYVNAITGNLETPYKDLFSEFNEVVINGLENNPREVKRFINSYIATQEVFKKDELNKEILLLLQIFQFRWPAFYNILFDFYDGAGSNFNEFCKHIIKSSKDQDFESPYKDYFDQYVETKEFLKSEKAKDIFLKLPEEEDLDKYRRSGTALGVGDEVMSKENLIKLLRENITEFNNFRQENPEILINLQKADIRGANMAGANLKDANLMGANLRSANLKNALLTNANLRGAKLIQAKLNRAELENSDLTEADLRNAELWHTNLTGAKLKESILKDAVLFNANLASADLSGANLNGAGLMSANMKGTIFYQAELRGCNIKRAVFDEMTDFRDADIDYITIQNLKGSNWTDVDKEKWDEYTLNKIKKEFNDSN